MEISPAVVEHIKRCTVAFALDLGPNLHPKVLGTGFLVNDQGYCITNAHVARLLLTPFEYWHTIELSTRSCVLAYQFIPEKGMATITARVNSLLMVKGFEKEPGKVYYGGTPDIAVFSTDLKGYPFLEFSDHPIPPEGTEAYFCGYPLGEAMFFEEHGLEQITSLLQRGIIAAHLPFSGIPNPHGFKIDATCNLGNSGSPVVAEDGKLIGMVYAKRTEAFTYALVIRDFKPLIQETMRKDMAGEIGRDGKMTIGQKYKPPPELRSEMVEALKKQQADEAGQKNQQERAGSGTVLPEGAQLTQALGDSFRVLCPAPGAKLGQESIPSDT